MNQTRLFSVGALVVCVAVHVPLPAAAQIRDSQDRALTAADGTAFVVTSGVVRVPEERTGTTSPTDATGTIDLAVVRVRRPEPRVARRTLCSRAGQAIPGSISCSGWRVKEAPRCPT